MTHKARRVTGAIAWALSVQYYIVQIIAGAAWSNDNRFSWSQNTISDLANTVCGPYGDRLVCSPLHTPTNLSFMVLGITMIAGAYLLATGVSVRITKLGLLCMGLAGVGTIIVGLFPENTVAAMHVLGAALPFIFGNIGMILIGVGARSSRVLRVSTIAAGALGLIALVLFVFEIYGPLGIGGLERIVAYPQSIWMVAVGLYVIVRNLTAVNTVTSDNT